MIKLLLSITIVFWNVENCFDYRAQTDNPSEVAFSSGGRNHWTKSRFYRKTRGIAKVLLQMSDSNLDPPDIICLSEVENIFVTRMLIAQSGLKKYGFKCIQFDSPDPRGIDCAILYRPEKTGVPKARPVPVIDPSGDTLRTRDILLAEFDSLTVAVCHFPSKLGSASRRGCAMAALEELALAPRSGGFVAVGDFNAPAAELPAPSDLEESAAGGVMPGTIKFQGQWDTIDRCMHSPGLTVRTVIPDIPCLSTPDKKYGGVKPLRTYSGPRYIGGLSDHYPIICYICFP